MKSVPDSAASFGTYLVGGERTCHDAFAYKRHLEKKR